MQKTERRAIDEGEGERKKERERQRVTCGEEKIESGGKKIAAPIKILLYRRDEAMREGAHVRHDFAYARTRVYSRGIWPAIFSNSPFSTPLRRTCVYVCVYVCVCGLFSSLRQVAFVRFLRACAICDTYTHTYTAVAVFLTAQTHSTRPLREYGHHAGPRAIPSSLIRFKRYSPSAFAPLLVPICYERGTSRVFLPLLEFNRNDSDDDDVDGCTMMTILAAQIFSSLLVYRQSKTWVVTT